MNEFKAYLIASDGSRQVLEGAMTVGRSSNCDVFIDEPRISRNHAEIRTEGHKVTLEDLGSVNGTKVNGDPLTSLRELCDGDQVAFDKISFTVEISNPA